MELDQPASHRLGVSGPRHVISFQFGAAERLIQHCRPPVANVPRSPRDAWRSRLVALMLGPIGAPNAIAAITDVRPSVHRLPKALFRSQPFEMEACESPSNLQLTH